MLIIFRLLFAFIAIFLACYSLFTQNFEFQGYMILFLGLAMFVSGIHELKQNRKIVGSLLIFVFLFCLYVSVQSFLYL